MQMNQFSWSHLNYWHFGILANILLISAGAIYALGARKAKNWPLAPSLFFFSGLVITFLATQSVIGYFDMQYFSAHMVQHLLLIMVAAPLFACARPLDLASLVGPVWLQNFINGRFMRIVMHPLVGFVAYLVFIPMTHLTGLFDLMMAHSYVHHFEQISFLVIGYLFFRVAFGLEQGLKLHPGLRLVYVMAAVPVDTFTGLALIMSVKNPFPGYAQMAPMGSTPASILDNVKLGGSIMWIGGDGLMLLACIPLVVMWVKWETVRTREIDTELDKLGL
jgi:putative copper resistance protein D